MAEGLLETERWIVVADSPFLPAHGGGEVEHLGFIRAACREGLLAALVIPTDADAESVGRDDDIAGIRSLVHPAPVVLTPRRRALGSALRGRLPYPVASRPAPVGLVRDVAAAAPDATGVLCFSYRSHAVAKALAEGLGLPGMVRIHNMEGRYFHALAQAKAAPLSWAVHAEAVRIGADERRLERAAWVRGFADISVSDATERRRRTRKPVAYVPTFALGGLGRWEFGEWRPQGEATVLFLGALDVPTNHEALRWLCRHIWPTVRARVPQARLRVVGRRPTSEVRALVADTEGSELLADVPHPREHMSRSAVAVNPAVSGSGVNIKLVEYLSTGVPVVSTALGAEGLGLRTEHDLLIRDDAADFAEAICMILADPDLASRIGRQGRRTAEALCDTGASLASLADLMHGRQPRPRASEEGDKP